MKARFVMQALSFVVTMLFLLAPLSAWAQLPMFNSGTVEMPSPASPLVKQPKYEVFETRDINAPVGRVWWLLAAVGQMPVVLSICFINSNNRNC